MGILNSISSIGASLGVAMPNTAPPKPPLNYEELRHIIDLCLWSGQLLLQNGADSHRVEEAVHRLGTHLGCDWLDVLVFPDGLLITTSSAGDFRTKTRRVVRIGVNLTTVAQVNDLGYRVLSGELDRFGVEAELRRISDLKPHYNRWLIVVMVGLSCGAFCQLFHGDLAAFFITTTAASIAQFVRQELHHRYFNPLMIVMLTALTAGFIASLAGTLKLTTTPQPALAAAVLLLVPGVPLVNAGSDLLRGYVVTGSMRGFNGLLISLCIAIGLLFAIALTGGVAP